MANAQNDVPGHPLANGGLDTSSLRHLTAPLPEPHRTPRILLLVTEPAGHNSHHAEVCRILATMTSDPVKDGRFTRFSLMAT